MGIALIKIKLMPESVETDLEDLKKKAKKLIEKHKGMKVTFEEQPIAFGLKALIACFDQDENEGELEPLENALGKIKGIGSVAVIDMRRAFG